eukprot:TRINITY_DN1825_c3_g1_i1.p1 TRINITY_DN1825_c3_g1~~TRINITY_DN1825_c3_g1_i1.p1  ORF type:complete len:285 (+),score=56.93 TRINITY_DN1825_c3_g1_i1:149-1003(+)
MSRTTFPLLAAVFIACLSLYLVADAAFPPSTSSSPFSRLNSTTHMNTTTAPTRINPTSRFHPFAVTAPNNTWFRVLRFNGTITYCGTSRTETATIYNKDVPVCVIIGGTKMLYFYPEIDTYSMIDIQQNNTVRDYFYNMEQWIAVESQGIVSAPRLRQVGDIRKGIPDPYYPETQLIVPYWVAIIHMTMGKVTSITWDDNCYGCSSSECINNQMCAIPYSYCGNQCTIKVYVSWEGTDSAGRYLLSSGKVPSRFQRYSMSSAFTNAFTGSTGALPENPIGNIPA